jgi:large subunit ribosomal protein L23
MNVNSVVIRPLITEQSMEMAGKGRFTFAVARFADKGSIKRAIEDKFGVDVVSIGTRVVKGKTKRVGIRRAEINETIWKKAIVTVKEGQKISIFDLGGGK